MVFRPQNLLQRLERTGRDLAENISNSARDFAQSVKNDVNITVGNFQDSIASKATEFQSATIDPILKIPTDLRDDLAAAAQFNSRFGYPTTQSLTPFPNPLRDFASYNYVFTLGVLSPYEVNFPDETYRVRDPSVIICRSGGGLGNSKANIEYENRYGRTEYYIDDVNIDSIIGMNPKTGSSNATFTDFKIYEPYSMGLFLQSVQVAAVKAGYKNYLEAPFLLTVEFKGWDDNGNYISKPDLRRMFPIKLSKIDFKVNEGGSEYQCNAYPWNEQGFSDQTQSLKTDITITGRTVSELLQSGAESLMTVLNTRELNRQQQNQVQVPHQYVIMFPTERATSQEALTGSVVDNNSATVNPNSASEDTGIREFTEEQRRRIFESITGTEDSDIPADFDAELSKILGIVVKRSQIGESIREYAENDENINEIGKSRIVESYLDGGQQPFGRPAFVEVTEQQQAGPPNQPTAEVGTGVFSRGKIQVSDGGRLFTFRAGMKIQEIIEEIIILSEYGRNIAQAAADDVGMIPWYRVECDCYINPDLAQNDQTGEYPKIFVYRVVPYRAHISRGSSPNKPGPGYDSLKQHACKEYNYIYTGQNDDIIDFNIEFDKAFFTSIMPFGGNNRYSNQAAESEQTAGDNPNPDVGPQEGDDTYSTAGSVTVVEDPNGTSSGDGGGEPVRTESQIARDFNKALVNSNVDLIHARMKIWGDPYFIADSGMGNYNAPETPIINLTQDGTMDYQSSEVDIMLNFRTPLDYDQEGNMTFPSLGTEPVGAFSGLYQVMFCNNTFYQGEFTQEMKLIRRRNQTGQDVVDSPTDTGNQIVQEIIYGPPYPTSDTGGTSEGANPNNIDVTDIDQAGRIRGGL